MINKLGIKLGSSALHMVMFLAQNIIDSVLYIPKKSARIMDLIKNVSVYYFGVHVYQNCNSFV